MLLLTFRQHHFPCRQVIDVAQAFELSITELFRQTVHRSIQQLLNKLPLAIGNIRLQ
jgi:hypothetical protein